MLKFLFLLLISFSAVADGLPDLHGLDDINNRQITTDIAYGNEWSTADKVYQYVFLALMAIDARYTQDIVRHTNLEEKNPVLGKNPSNSRINIYFSVAALTHTIIADQFPEFRRGLQKSGIAIELGATVNNFNMGLNIGF